MIQVEISYERAQQEMALHYDEANHNVERVNLFERKLATGMDEDEELRLAIIASIQETNNHPDYQIPELDFKRQLY